MSENMENYGFDLHTLTRVCKRCSALVQIPRVHDEFHDLLDKIAKDAKRPHACSTLYG